MQRTIQSNTLFRSSKWSRRRCTMTAVATGRESASAQHPRSASTDANPRPPDRPRTRRPRRRRRGRRLGAPGARRRASTRSGSTTRYFERDGVSFAHARSRRPIAADDDDDEAGFRVALGAVNPFTRHPVVLAMTGSALDEILPGRIVHGPRDRAAAAAQADGHPVRARRRPSSGVSPGDRPASGRCGPASGCRRRRRACRRSSRCSRRPTGSRSSSPPTARSSSSSPARRPTATSPGRPSRSRRCAGSSSGSARRPTDAGRDPAAIETAGYLLSLVDETRREALNRAKREPFVIYMMSVLSDVSLRAGRVRRASCATGSPPPGGPRTTRPPATSSPTSCSTRSCCAARARTSRPGRWPSTPRPGSACRSSSRSSRRTARSTS